MMSPAAPPALRLVQGGLGDPPDWSWFCGQCAATPNVESVSPLARVCPACGMGLLLETRSDAAPVRNDAFLVIDSRLTVQAVSRRAAALLSVSEEDAINRPVACLLGPADAEDCDPVDLVAALRAASTQSDELYSLCVSPRGAFGVRILARIASCGPPRAALVVLGDYAPRRDLHIV